MLDHRCTRGSYLGTLGRVADLVSSLAPYSRWVVASPVNVAEIH
jgi:hypothetical protein